MGVLVAGLLAASLCIGAGDAMAAYKVKLDTGTLKITGDAASDKLVLRLDPGSPTTLQLDVGADGTTDFSFDRSTFTTIVVEAGAGDDEVRVDQSGGTFVDESLTINGGDGADTLLGGAGVQTFLGGKGNDFVAGGDDNDRAFLGDGDDVFVWNPGDDSDVVEGQGGTDQLQFFGANVSETIGVSANGQRVRFTRDIAAIAMDLNDVERVDFHARGGADTITVDDLSGTDAKTVALDLNGVGGGGDGFVDTVTAAGTQGADRVNVGTAASDVLVSGLSAQIQVAGSDVFDSVNVAARAGADTITTAVGVSGPGSVNVDGGDGADTMRYNGTAGDDAIQVVSNGTAVSTVAPATAQLNTTVVESLVVSGLGGMDTIAGTGNLAPLTALTIDGGEGNDSLRGGNGADMLIGGTGNDFVDGNQGIDSALLGDGDDRFEWDPGDGSDTVDGQGGMDVLDFFGSNIGETIAVVANSGRVRLTRDIGAITMNFDNIEGLALHALGGADPIIVDDLTGTDLKSADVDLSPFGGGGDGQQDMIVANGTSKSDIVSIDRSASDVLVSGLPAQLRIAGGEGTNDTLLVQTLGGNDDATVAPTVQDLIAPVVNLGADE